MAGDNKFGIKKEKKKERNSSTTSLTVTQVIATYNYFCLQAVLPRAGQKLLQTSL